METNRSAVSSSMPRPKRIAYASAWRGWRGLRRSPRAGRRRRRRGARRRAGCRRGRAAAAARRGPSPPRAEIEQLGEPGVGVGELPLVDHRARLSSTTGDHPVQHPIERQVAGADPVAEGEPAHTRFAVVSVWVPTISTVASCRPPAPRARRRSAHSPRRTRRRAAEGGSAPLDRRVGARRERGHLEPAFERPFVQGLDVRHPPVRGRAPECRSLRPRAPRP